MNRLLLAATTALLIAGGCSSDPVGKSAGTPRPSRQYTIEEFMDTIRIAGASFTADEADILVSSDESGVFGVYSVSVRDGRRTAVTRSSADSTYLVTSFPRDPRVLFTRDTGGNEQNHLFVREADGTERDLTPGAKLKAQFVDWSGDDTAFYVATNERDPRYFDLYRYAAAGYGRTMIYRNTNGMSATAVSRDGRWVALDRPNLRSDSDIHLYRVDTGEVRHLTPHRGNARHVPETFDPSSAWLYYLTDDGTEFMRVRRCNLATGQHEEVEQAPWDIQSTRFSRNGRYRITVINEDARTVVRLHDHATGRPVDLPRVAAGGITSVTVSDSGHLMAFHVSGDRGPGDLHVWDVRTGTVRQLTQSLSPRVDAQDLVASEIVRFKSFDGLEIPNVLYRPHQATATRKAPALVWVHGGPGGQTRQIYSAQIQHLVNHGYVVLGINNRGSSGYGKSFYAADDRKHGREPLWDCVAARKYLAGLPWVDADRIGIIGGSYGGYMVLAALAYQPEEFKCGVDIFGVANWLRTLENIPPWWEAQRKSLYEELGDPVKDRELLREISPVFHADRIRRPLLVLQGANDPRVLKAESDDIVAAVRRSGVPVDYVVFDDEGHGFTKKKNQVTGQRATLEFLDRYLR